MSRLRIISRFLFCLCWLIPAGIKSQDAPKLSDTALISAILAKAGDARGDEAIQLYDSAIQTAEKCLSYGGSEAYKRAVKREMIKARLRLGLVYYNRIEYSKALDIYYLALNESDNLGDIHLEAESYFNIAEVYLEQSQFSDAMEFYNLSLSAYKKVNDNISQFWCYTGMGIVQKQCGNYKDAVEFYNKALQKANSAGLNYEEAICYNNLGNVYRKTGEFARAMESYQKIGRASCRERV